MPIVFTFDQVSMLCSVSWGTMGAPGATKASQMQPTARRGIPMSNYIMLINYTEKGVQNIKSSPKRADTARFCATLP